MNAKSQGMYAIFDLTHRYGNENGNCRSAASSSSSSDTSAGQRFPPHNRTLGVGEFRVGGGVHDSYTFQCGLVGSFTSPGIDTR